MRRPRFSLLIATHGRPALVRRCFESLRFSLTRDDVECIVLDDGSGPEVGDILRREPGIDRLIAWPQRRGVAAARAELLRQARGHILVFLDSDVVIEDSAWLDRLARWLRPAQVGMAGPAGAFVAPDWERFEPAPPGECDTLAGWCIALKRAALAAGARFDPAYAPFWHEDNDLALQVRALGWAVVCTGPVGVGHTPGLSGDRPGLRARNLAHFRRKWQGKGLVRAECGY